MNEELQKLEARISAMLTRINLLEGKIRDLEGAARVRGTPTDTLQWVVPMSYVPASWVKPTTG